MRLPVTVKLKSSPTLVGAVFFAHGLAAFAVLSLGLPRVPTIIGNVILLLSLQSFVRRAFRQSIQALTMNDDGTLELQTPDGRGEAAEVRAGTVVFPWLIVLLLRVGVRSVALALPPDAIEREGHRRLRLWLRWKANAQSA